MLSWDMYLKLYMPFSYVLSKLLIFFSKKTSKIKISLWIMVIYLRDFKYGFLIILILSLQIFAPNFKICGIYKEICLAIVYISSLPFLAKVGFIEIKFYISPCCVKYQTWTLHDFFYLLSHIIKNLLLWKM